MRHAIAKAESVLPIVNAAGLHWTKTGLFFDTINEESLLAAGLSLQLSEHSRAWWWGDFLCAYCAHELSKEPKATREEATFNPESLTRRSVSYTARYSSIADAHPGTLRIWKLISDFYPHEQRIEDMSWLMHREAYDGAAGELSAALKWLKRARHSGWSAIDLRAAIRTEKAHPSLSPIEEHAIERGMKELVSFNRWSRMEINRLSSLPFDEKVLIRRELEPAARLIAALDAELAVMMK